MKNVCLFSLVSLACAVSFVTGNAGATIIREGGTVMHDKPDTDENRAEVQRIFNSEVQDRFAGFTDKYLIVQKIERKATQVVAGLITYYDAIFVESKCLRNQVRIHEVTPKKCAVAEGSVKVKFHATSMFLIGRDPTVDSSFEAALGQSSISFNQ